jgi:DNA (cytosine-5)-methyltransferase 1
MKVLNLYACLGGNRYKWDEVAEDAGIELEITAVELDSEAARLYQERFPNDTVIVGDAHQYLLDNYKEFDFIWSSPPCPTHSRLVDTNKNRENVKVKYPDMKLYQEIILLDKFFKGKYCVENVIPFYKPLIPAKKRGRHLYWTNFALPNNINDRDSIKGVIGRKFDMGKMCEFHKYDFRQYKGKQPLKKIAANLVDYQAGKTIFETALGIYKANNSNQTTLEL